MCRECNGYCVDNQSLLLISAIKVVYGAPAVCIVKTINDTLLTRYSDKLPAQEVVAPFSKYIDKITVNMSLRRTINILDLL